MNLNYQVCSSLRTIPESKLLSYKNNTIKQCELCKDKQVYCDKCILKLKLIQRYFESNIPIDFWSRKINEFEGDQKLIKLFNTLTQDLDKTFNDMGALFLKGSHGTGKTFFSSLVLKKFIEKGYSGLYTTMFDIVNVLVYADNFSKFNANKELKMCDFLILDEFDSRFIGNNAGELFGKILESVLRIRLQNYMPTILITNNSDPTKALGEALGNSISSLISGYVQEIFVIGKDFRKSK